VRLIVDLDTNYHGHILAYINCPQFTSPQPIHLVIDTGSTNTTLLGDDVTRLSINCTNLMLSPTPCQTAHDLVRPYLLPNVEIGMEVREGWLNRQRRFRIVEFPSVNCMPPTHPQFMTRQRVRGAYSLLGMDFLRLFKKWKFAGGFLFLDT